MYYPACPIFIRNARNLSLQEEMYMKRRHIFAGVCLAILLASSAEALAAESPDAAPAPTPLGVFTTTGYCPCESCSGRWGRLTSTGALACAGHTVAVDPQIIPYGTRLMINGVIYTAEDCGGGVNGNHIDIFYNTHEESRAHGTQAAEVFLIQQTAVPDAVPSPLS